MDLKKLSLRDVLEKVKDRPLWQSVLIIVAAVFIIRELLAFMMFDKLFNQVNIGFSQFQSSFQKEHDDFENRFKELDKIKKVIEKEDNDFFGAASRDLHKSIEDNSKQSNTK